MNISYRWLQDYFETELPQPKVVADMLTRHSFEIESIDSVGDDTVLDVKVLPDRAHDCLSYAGIAKELASISGGSLRLKYIKDEEIQVPESNILRVEVEKETGCKRFSTLVIEHVEVKESPLWLKEALQSMGARSINNVVDATNFVMFSLGQPLHAYDRDLLTEDGGMWKLGVRFAKEGEVVKALDDREYTLSPSDVVITDNDTAIGIAGVKGGKSAEITHSTKHIILEAGSFDPIKVRKTSKSLGLRTDASVRFENEITPMLATKALHYAQRIISEIAGGSEYQVEGMTDWFPRKPGVYKVGVSERDVQDILGIPIDHAQLIDTLTKRAYPFVSVSPREYIVKHAPTYIGIPYTLGASITYDAPRTFDCSSFTSYLHAEAGIAIPRMSVDQYVYGKEISKEELLPGDLVFSNSNIGRIHYESVEWKKGTKVEQGIDHVGIYMGNDLVIHATKAGNGVVVEESLSQSPMFKNIVGYRRCIPYEEERVVVSVPYERIDMRTTHDLVEDIGKIFGYEHVVGVPISAHEKEVRDTLPFILGEQLREMFVSQGFSEVITYVFREKGERELENPLAKDKAFLRDSLVPGMKESFALSTYNAPLLNTETIALFEIGTIFKKDEEVFSCAFVLSSLDKKKSESIAQRIQEIQNAVKDIIGKDVSFVLIDGVYEAIIPLALQSEDLPRYSGDYGKTISRFSSYPFVLRDIAVFVPEGDDAEDMIRIIDSHSDGLLRTYRCFDTFTKEFPEGKKTSYAYRLVFQSFEKTLTAEEVLSIMDRSVRDIEKKEGWIVR